MIQKVIVVVQATCDSITITDKKEVSRWKRGNGKSKRMTMDAVEPGWRVVRPSRQPRWNQLESDKKSMRAWKSVERDRSDQPTTETSRPDPAMAITGTQWSSNQSMLDHRGSDACCRET